MTRKLVLDGLPGEILDKIASSLDLRTAIAFSQTSSALRGIYIDSVVQDLVDNWQSSTEADRLALANLARRPNIATAGLYAYVLKHGHRSFLLDHFEIPPLSNNDWRLIFAERFFTNTVERAAAVTLPWRAKYWRELRHLEHVYETSCSRMQTMVTYFTLYRHDRLTINRISPLQMNHQAIFSSMKGQANLANYATRMTAFRAKPDTRFMVLYCSGDKPLDHYQANTLSTDLIRSVEETSSVIRKGLPEGHIVLGPSLILCTIAAGSPSSSREDEHIAYHDVSFDALVEQYPPLKRLLPNGPEIFMGYV